MLLQYVSSFQLFFALLGPTIAADGTHPPVSGLSWTGEVAGHGRVTLYGDASSVEEQIFALNPSLATDYAPTSPFMTNNRPSYEASEVFDAGNSTYYYKYPDRVAARNDIHGSLKLSDFFGPMHWDCSTFATGDANELQEVVSRVGAPGGQDAEHAMWSIAGLPGGTNCERLACAGTRDSPGSTAVYWCNDTGEMVTTEASNLAAVAASIASGHRAFNFAGCCLQSQMGGEHHQVSGQMHLGNDTNINIGYGECSVPAYFSRPNEYGYPGDLGSCS
ncbi:hypothetical protein KVR01_012630 [Diaporthe batatas]|uniref:uncharacterized protein n=1 Tax=Diaporthe batatas TaxID=748121 RepID=UPI001D04DC22|nr:uncharacterized protein KVR01_012630 [Diaporthe batatas]KAG8157588.1 hypothetical protein KVR01_012630 [Diaporthe batatas]